MNRVTFLIDGFNLYHSIRTALYNRAIRRGKWLNIRALCESYVSSFGEDAQLFEIYYFSALADHIPGAAARHEQFLKALRASGVKTRLGKFKKKIVRCKATCKGEGIGYEEKETDVNIALKMFELFMLDQCDTCVVMTGDTDLNAALTSAKRLFTTKKIGVIFPYARDRNNEAKRLVDNYVTIKPEDYQKYQFTNPVVREGKSDIIKPPDW
jgi:uncharacterized LabA/DUF88 family protein